MHPFAIEVVANPRVEAVTPAFGSAQGGTLLTISGTDLVMPDDESTVSVLVGTGACALVRVDRRPPQRVLCTTAPGIGLHNVTLIDDAGDLRRTGALVSSFTQALVLYAGRSAQGGGGFLAGGPRPEDVVVGSRSDGPAFLHYATAHVFPGLNPAADRAVLALASFQQRIFLGGSFSEVGGEAMPYLACLDGAAVRPVGVVLDGPVYALATYNTSAFHWLVVGGAFTEAAVDSDAAGGGTQGRGLLSTGGIAAWDGTAWRALGLEGGVPLMVNCLLAQGSTLFVAGHFPENGEPLNPSLSIEGSRFPESGEPLNPSLPRMVSLHRMVSPSSRSTPALSRDPSRWKEARVVLRPCCREGSTAQAQHRLTAR